jgi:hypothetical protein
MSHVRLFVNETKAPTMIPGVFSSTKGKALFSNLARCLVVIIGEIAPPPPQNNR